MLGVDAINDFILKAILLFRLRCIDVNCPSLNLLSDTCPGDFLSNCIDKEILIEIVAMTIS